MKVPLFGGGEWTIIEEGFDAARVPAGESVFSLANGSLGIRYSFEEGSPVYKPGTYVNGFYENLPITYGENAFGFPLEKQTILTLPDAASLKLFVNGEPFSMEHGRLLSHTRILDMKSAAAAREVLWESSSGVTLRMAFRRMVSFSRPDLACIRLTVTAVKGACSLEIESGILLPGGNTGREWDPRTGTAVPAGSLHQLHAETTDDAAAVLVFRAERSGLAGITAVTHESGGFTASGLRRGPGPAGEELQEGSIRQYFKASLGEGASAVLSKYIYCGRERNRPVKVMVQSARKELASAREAGFTELEDEQSRFMARFWEKADVRISGSLEDQRHLRFGIFSLLQAAGNDGFTSIASKGLSGDGYDGHVFWEAEIYALPFFLYTEPARARSLLNYRYSILDKARARAGELQHRGALFPWRTINGTECSAYFPAGTAQYHINADISYSLQKYINNTGDFRFLLDGGAEILIDTARFWMSIAQHVQGKGYCIHTVTGPDEYTALVDNNAYTNLMAKNNLLYAVSAVNLLSSRFPKEFSLLGPKIGLQEGELQEWQTAADSMYVPYSSERGLFKQDDSFMEKPAWPSAIREGAHEPLLLRCHPLTIYRHKVLKQPDLVLASFLLHDWFSAADRLRAFDFYDPLTTGDSSLSAPVQCITSAAAGYPETAYGYFRLTCLSDTADVHGNTKDGLHLAAAAGTWLSVVYGFLGLHDRGAVPRFFPRYPKTSGWTSLTAKLLLRGNLVELKLKPDEMIYVLKEGKDAALTHEYTPVTLKKPGDISSHSLVPKLEAVIFDLDGVITDTAEFHYLAWKKIADELGLPFDRELNHRLRGIGRMESLAVIIENARADISGERRAELAARKNGYYREYLETLTPEDLLAGIEDLLEDLKKDGVKTALASASKNAQLVLSKLKAGRLFDTVIDAGRITVGKPDPEIFLKAAELLETPCRNCAGIEDAQAGIDAIRAAGMVSVGIGSRLRDADLVLGGTEELTLPALRKLFP